MEVRYLCTQQSPIITHQGKSSQHCTSAVADRQFVWDESLNSGLQLFLKSYPLPLHASGAAGFTEWLISDRCWQLELSGGEGMRRKAAAHVLIVLAGEGWLVVFFFL